MKVCIISAMDPKRSIGRDNSLMWSIPKDMSFFRKITMGNVVVMGRKTYESIGGSLKGRENVVLTKDKTRKIDGVVVLHSVDELLERYQNELERTIFIIGGAQIYRVILELSVVDEMYISHIKKEYPNADAFFPKFIKEEWTLKEIENYEEFFIIKYIKKII